MFFSKFLKQLYKSFFFFPILRRIYLRRKIKNHHPWKRTKILGNDDKGIPFSRIGIVQNWTWHDYKGREYLAE